MVSRGTESTTLRYKVRLTAYVFTGYDFYSTIYMHMEGLRVRATRWWFHSNPGLSGNGWRWMEDELRRRRMPFRHYTSPIYVLH